MTGYHQAIHGFSLWVQAQPFLVGILLWNTFRLSKWPLQMTVIIFAVRLAGISLQLSISPNLPRLVFKIGWDILFCIILLSVSLIFMLYEQWNTRGKIYTPEVVS